MYSAAIDVGVGLLAQYGLFVLLVAFALEGALVGKLIPTRTLFVAAVLAIGTTTVGMVSVVVVVAAGATLGQLVLFGAVRYTNLTPESVPGTADPIDGSRIAGWFDRWGLSAVAVSNALPLARGSLTVPVAMTDEDPLRFSASSMAGTSVYACGLLVVAISFDIAIGLL
jgi:membrane protein DedA with SNARE-associated domain